ncbi:hypothetical protein [Streptosporangium sp. CA-115845]|uniref:hypothetical protein n=1 Tax=Streptosporangium sp. CA-115845 TaxID=3240071 RepID=UPI003D8D8164
MTGEATGAPGMSVYGLPAPRIEDVIQQALDTLGDDLEYADARTELHAATGALAAGTTADARAHIDRALALIDRACPI